MRLRRNGTRWGLLGAALFCFLEFPAHGQRDRVTPRASDARRAPPVSDSRSDFVFTRVPEGIVQVSTWKATSFPIETSGGAPPVTLAFTSDRPDLDLLEITGPPTATGIPSRSPGEGSMPGHPDSLRVPPRALRFKGFDRHWGAGIDLPVTVTATDANGRTISRSFTVEALPGRISKFQAANSSVVRGQNTSVTATVDLLPPGATVSVQGTESWVSSAPRGIERHPCSFSANFGTANTGPTLTADSGGRVSLPLSGTFFARDTAKTGPCSLGLVLDVTPPGGQSKRIWALASMETVRISAPVTYRIDRTWALSSKFRFAVHPPLPGSCIGASAYTGGVFPIGAFEDENGDLALAVRSGPLGTDCKAQSPPWVLPDGFHLVSIDWDVQKTGSKCCLGEACLPASAEPSGAIIVPGAIPSEDPQVYETASRDDPLRDATQLSAGPNPARLVRRIFNSTEARLACREADSNDQGVRATLKSVTFEGPPGQTFP
jgi:hypothetical protein